MCQKKYDNSIAIAKGIAIILMVGGHASYSCYANDLLSICRMPLFFVMSGYLFKTTYLDNVKEFLAKRISGLYLPLVKYSLIFLALHNLFFHIGIYNNTFIDILDVSRWYTAADFLERGIRIITTMHGYDRLLGGYWFVHTLFWASIIFYFSQRVFGAKYIFQTIVLLILSVLIKAFGLYIPYFHVDYLPFMAASMMMFGRMYHEKKWCYHKNALFIITSLLVVAIVAYWMPTAMPICLYYQIVPYTIASIMGTMVIFALSQYLEQCINSLGKFLTYVGKRTFAVLTWHMLSFKIVTLAIIFVYNEPYSRLAETLVLEDYVTNSVGGVISYWIVGLIIPLLIDYCVKIRKNIEHTNK